MSKAERPDLASVFPTKGNAAKAEPLPDPERPQEEGKAPTLPSAPGKDDTDVFSIRIKRATHARLLRLKQHSGYSKQSLIEMALSEFLDRYNA